ncbi:S-layer homology domain-containing protein [Anaerovorax odorimutans]|uniref:S-layer homology domain-containing protein n=1 Tax=Anaerovorax odorimutans TaxID=109327 RepID=UPI0004058882|nr:S-layer homology domain-containing protein [Anaerovorax odorimutans]
MKKRILSMALCLCMVFTLLPTTALAADANVRIGSTTLTNGKYYIVSSDAVTELDSAPASGGYLYYTQEEGNAVLTVTGDVTYISTIPALSITACTLTLTGSGNLSMTSSMTPAVNGNSNSSLITSNYTGALNFISGNNSAITNCTDMMLETTGALIISGNSDSATIYSGNDVTLKGGIVSLTNLDSDNSQLISAGGESVSVTATGGDLSLIGSTSVSPLLIADSGEQGTSGIVTLSASGSITVANDDSGMAVGCALNASAGKNITLESTDGMAVGGNLTVTDAENVIISGGRSDAPTISGTATITADKDITINSAFMLDIGGIATLTAGGLVIRTTSTGTTITKDGTTISASYGGDIRESGLNISGKDDNGNNDSTYNAPAAATLYKAGDGYALFTPAVTGDSPANAKLEFLDATIETTDATALSLPSTEPVDITVTGDNLLRAGGSKNVIATNTQELSVTGGGNLILAGLYYGVNVNGTDEVTINITGDLTFDTASQPISTSGDITVSAKSITSKSGYYFSSGNGMVSLTATDGDIVIDDTEKTNKQEKIKAAGAITLNAPNGKIDITHDKSGCYALNSTFGIITVTALNDVIINAINGGGIYSGANTDTSDVISVKTTNGSIQMNCGDNYECVQAIRGVALEAAKDITLNGTEQYSAAIQATGSPVSITAGGKLSSTSAFGFQMGILTIQADEVSIAGTSQDGINANSVSITKDGTNNCKSVSVTATSNYDSWAAINSPNVIIKADNVLICGNSSAKAISATNPDGTVTIGDAGMIIGAVFISGTSAINPNILNIESTGVDASAGLNLSTPPSVITYYKAGNGYALFTPATTTTPATLTLHNASITSGSTMPLKLVEETVIKLEGANSLTNTNTNTGVGISASSSTNVLQPVIIQGGSGDSLNVSAWQCTQMSALTIDGGSVTMDGMIYGILLEGNMVLKNGAKVSASGGNTGDAVQLEGYSLTVSDGSTLTINESAAYITGDLTISGSGSKVTINRGATAMVLGIVQVENSGVLENNGIWQMKLGTKDDDIKALKLTGIGVVKVLTNEPSPLNPPIWDTYTNEGVKVKEISSNLDLTTSGDSGNLTADGYHWDETNNTLTLGDVFVSGSLTLPDNTIIKTTSGSTISGGINGAGGTAMHLTFEGTAPLVINGIISLGANGDTVTVKDGAQVAVNGSLSLGVYDGMLNVIGSGTKLNISSDSSYAALCGEVNVENGASLTAKAAGSNAVGLKVEKFNAASGKVSVSGGSTLTVGCDYGVYVKDGSFTIDESSTFTANAAIAAICVVDTSKTKQQSQTLKVPSSMLPSGTKITDAVGNTVGCGYHYFSIANNANTLSATNEGSNPATLTGALGALTLKKASSGGNDNNNGGNNNSGNHNSGGGSVSYTLTFETSEGSKISSASKAYGTVINLSSYKPTRDGYDFAGWYSDAALTSKITSVTLTKSTTIYAKWTGKNAEGASPFTDVTDSAYYHDAVMWASEKGITSGTTSSQFSPDMICTRAQAVTFLWRAKGSPEPASANCPFTDVSADAYYYKAVLWAIEKGIVKGTSPTTFSPSDTVTRSQSMTFLWRATEETTSASANPFSDVSKNAYYDNAVLWAVEKGITKGTSATTFSPDGGCTRAQIVTFLYRYMGK